MIIAILILALMVMIAVGIAHAAWQGRPKYFSRDMYWTVFVASGFAGGGLVVFAQRMNPTKPWQLFVQELCAYLGLLLFAVSLGCGISIFTYRRMRQP